MDDFQQTRRTLYAMRNGIVADALRRAGCPRRLIFGVNLPQLAEIAAATGQSTMLAERLWADGDLRESALLAPMLFPAESLDAERAIELVDRAASRTSTGTLWVEELDILCFKLLRNAPCAIEVARSLAASEHAALERRYAAQRLYMNLLAARPTTEVAREALGAARDELARPDALQLAASVADEAAFQLNEY